MFVIILTYVKPVEEIDKWRPAHLEFLDRYYAEGIFVASGRQNPLKGGVILARGGSRQMIERILAEDPFFTEKLATFQIIEFAPNKYHPALAAVLA